MGGAFYYLHSNNNSGTESISGRDEKEKDGEKGRVVFHELWISEAALSAHRHQLTRREGKGQQLTSN